MASFGEVLRRERELRQITLREISEATKINLRYLEALERDDFRHLPGGVFNKGFVRAFAQHIGVDAETMVDAYLEEQRNQTGGDAAVIPVEGALPAEPEVGERIPRRAVAVGATAAVLLVAAAAAALLWSKGWLDPGAWIRSRGDAPRTLTSAVPPPPKSDGGALPPADGEVDRPPADSVPGFTVRVVLARPVQGRVRCDEGQPQSLDGVASGATLELVCLESLEVDADDGGAVLVGFDGRSPEPAGADGAPLSGHRVRPEPPTATGSESGLP